MKQDEEYLKELAKKNKAKLQARILRLQKQLESGNLSDAVREAIENEVNRIRELLS